MNKCPRNITTLSVDINVCQLGAATKQDLVSLFQVKALVIEEYLPRLLPSYYYYSML
jgi:hypothetical protein